MFDFLKSMYDRHLLTAKQVWAAAAGVRPKITQAEALIICGPKPNEK